MLAGLFLALSINRAENLFMQTKNHLQADASLTAYRASMQISLLVDQRYADLNFLKSLLYSYSSRQLHPTPKLQNLFTIFQHAHPGITAVNIQNVPGNTIIWSSQPQSSRPISLGDAFISIADNPQDLLGSVRYASRDHQWVMTMRVKVLDNENHILGFIGSPFQLSNFHQIYVPTDVNAMVWNPSRHMIISQWTHGQWSPPSSDVASVHSLSSSVEATTTTVGNLPWQLQVQWTPHELMQDFWRSESPRIPVLLIIFLSIGFMDVITQSLLRRLLRQRFYQQAMLSIQQVAVAVSSPIDLYRELVNILANKTDALLIYIQQGATNDPTAEILTMMQNQRLTDKGVPFPSLLSPSMTQVGMGWQNHPWSRHLTEYVFAFENQDAPLQLIVKSDEPNYFTKDIQTLFTELVHVLQTVLKQWADQQTIALRDQQLLFLAEHDSLTKLPNRRKLTIELEHVLARAKRHEKGVAICMFDLDGFKHINDAYGHEAGDDVLKGVAERVPLYLRKTDSFFRWGGDEFVLILEDLTHRTDMHPLLAKLQPIVESPIHLSGNIIVHLGVSIGVRYYDPGENADSGEALLRDADQALYESKHHKLDRQRPWVVFDEFTTSLHRNLEQQWLDQDRVEVWYQPIYNTELNQAVSMEALARLRSFDGRIVLPGEFLPHLDVADLFRLSQLVLKQSLADLLLLEQKGISLGASLNIDPLTLTQTCVESIKEILASTSIAPDRITIELLERSDFLVQSHVYDLLQSLRSLGVRIALDDIGTAYASLARIKELPIDEIKLDQSFVQILPDHPEDISFIYAMKTVADGLQMNFVIEGTETIDIVNSLRILKVPLLQGYGIARPMPFDTLVEWLSTFSLPDTVHLTPLYLYTKQWTSSTSLRQMAMWAPDFLALPTIMDSEQCEIHPLLEQSEMSDLPLLHQLHDNYHHIVANTILNDTNDFRTMDQAQLLFLQAMLGSTKRPPNR
jgi:diguanylate cyclase (GGDEF)-like protein